MGTYVPPGAAGPLPVPHPAMDSPINADVRGETFDDGVPFWTRKPKGYAHAFADSPEAVEKFKASQAKKYKNLAEPPSKEYILSRRRSQPNISLMKQYQRQKFEKLFDESTFVVAFQHSMTVKDTMAFTQEIAKESEGRSTVRLVIKNSVCRHTLAHDHDGKFADLAPAFHGPTSIVYGSCEENMLQDLKVVLKLAKKYPYFVIGGLVDRTVCNHKQMSLFNEIESTVHLHSELINLIQSPAHNLIRVLQNPTNNLVKVLDFKAKQDGAPEEGEAEATS